MKPTHIVIHHSATADSGTVSWQAIRWYHTRTRGWTDIGYQAGIELVSSRYEILLGRMLNQQGAHCPQNGMNRCSVGICMIGDFNLMPPPPAQMDLLTRFVRALMAVLAIEIGNVTKHSDHNPATACPGKLFPWEQFIDRLK